MRKTLSFVVAAVVISAFVLAPVKGVGSPSVSVYAPAISAASLVDPPTLLPLGENDHPFASTVDPEVRPPVGPENSIVEAIPTPTAFHAGGMLLLLIFLGRFIRKPRWI